MPRGPSWCRLNCGGVFEWSSYFQRYECTECGNTEVDHEVEAKKLLKRGEIEKFLHYCNKHLDVPWRRG